MKLFLHNNLIFFGVYLPLTLLLGLTTSAFHVPGVDNPLAYAVFLWMVITLQLVVPSYGVYATTCLVATLVHRRWGYFPARATAYAGLLTMLILQAGMWSGTHLSLIWVWVCVLPAVLLGGLIRFGQKTSTTTGDLTAQP